jgi:hypothetical protein
LGRVESGRGEICGRGEEITKLFYIYHLYVFRKKYYHVVV